MMSYQVLARKWRPQCYADVVGQPHALAVLANSCTLNRLHHAYLFSGSRGIGKTTLARLFAKGLNCATGITATPCRQCSPCQEIEQGRFVDLLEIDAASRTKVEDTRELLDNIHYAPGSGRFKIYLIDEVHMLSRHSFNALLKTLEEPPAHVKFLLATTDPQKLPATLLSRCLQLHLQLLSVEQIETQLQKILQAEAIIAEPPALRLLARAAQGSVRDALTLTDQALALGEGGVNTELVRQLLGRLDSQQAIALVEALHRVEADHLLQLVDQVISQGGDCEQLLIEMAEVLHQIALQQWAPPSLGALAPGMERIRELAQQIAPGDLQLYYQILLLGRKELPLAPDPRMGVEMTLLRALAFHPKSQDSTALSAPKRTSRSTDGKGAADPLLSTETAPREIPVEPPQEISPPSPENLPLLEETTSQAVAQGSSSLVVDPAVLTSSTAPMLSETDQLLAIHQQLRGQQRQHRTQRQSSTSPAATGADAPARRAKTPQADLEKPTAPAIQRPPVPTPPSGGGAAEWEPAWAAEAAKRDSWSADIAQLTLPKRLEQLALNSVYEQRAPHEVCLYVRPAQRHLNRPEAPAALAKALSELRGSPVTVTIVEGDNSLQRTPLEWRQAIYQEQLTAARQALQADKNLQRLQRDFAAEIDEESIQPGGSTE